jgi:hypothetical protein
MTKYIKYTHVDAVTRVPVTEAPAANGPADPAVDGLAFGWARESQYPTDKPEFFGSCADDADTSVPGVLLELTLDEYEQLYDVEMAARNPVPPSVSRAQGKAALIQSGLWDDVLTFVAAIPDATDRALAEVALHDTTTWQRSSPFLNAAAAALGMDGAALDALFVTAAGIEL